MNRSFLAVAAAALVVLMTMQPAAACRTIKPKTWAGTIAVATQVNTTSNSYVLGGCKFVNASQQGSDALVFDVTSHRGLKAAAKWSTTSPAQPEQVDGVFYSAACSGLPGTGFNMLDPAKSVAFTIPTTAKWLIVSAYTTTPAKDIAVTVTSPGRKCS